MPNLKPIRRSQLISPFGVGAIVAFPGDESLMTAGLDEWPQATRRCPPDWEIREERLEQRLRVSHFRLPPDYREPGHGIQHPNQYIPFVRFPQWHYCPLRGVMERVPLFSTPRRCPCRSDLDCHARPAGRRPWLIPSRFIAVCVRGHVEDFPFMEWLHGNDGWDATHQLRLLPGRSSATLAGVKVECTCGKKKSMGGTFNFSVSKGGSLHKIGYDCSGTTPWLGKAGKPGECGEYLRVAQRGASNVYFPFTTSSIHLPRGSTSATDIAAKYLDDPMTWLYLSSDLEDGERISLSKCEDVVRSRDIRDVTTVELQKAAQGKLDGDPPQSSTRFLSEEAFRRQEYESLRTSTPDDSGDLLVEVLPSARYGEELRDTFRGVGLVRRLRETRVFIGFSRLLPAEDPTDPRILPISQDRRLGWLPAIVVHGEGIFFEFDSARLTDWTSRRSVVLRVKALNRRYNEKRQTRGLAERKITAKYVLLHTFAHVLISQLSLDCGYGTASLRERLYCDMDDNSAPMQGVLIYTASGDSEGTLGGLVRQADPRRLTGILRRAILRSRWCSSDPVCIGSAGQGNDNANLAACHNCTLLPETSCETGNRLLDRALIVGTPSEPDIGFFTEDPSES